MRRPVGVKWVLFSFCWTKVFLPPSLPLSPCFHPHSRGAICLRSVHVGRSRYSRCCHLFSALWFCSCRVEPKAINAVTGTRLWAFVFSLPGTVLILLCCFVLRGCRHVHSAAVVQWFVYFSAHPQVMQQHRQLSRGGHDGSLLAVPSSTFG